MLRVEPRLSVQSFDDDKEADAPRIILVHGVMDRGASFSRVVGYLYDEIVVTYDRRGYAHSMDAPISESLDTHVDDLIDVIGDTPSYLIGHSLGGAITLTVAARRPELVKAVGVYESPLPWLPDWPTAASSGRAFADDTDPATAAENFMRYISGNEAWEMLPMKTQQQRKAEGPALMADMRMLHVDAAPFAISDVTVPVSVAGGSTTQEHHKQGCEVMAKLFNTEVQWIDGAGHGGHMSHPGPFATFVRRTMRNS